MTTVKYQTSGMHCPSCSMLIQMNLGDLPGVESVDSNHQTGITTVTFDENTVTAERIAQEIRTSGYEAELIS